MARGSPRQGPVLRLAHSRPFVEYVAQPSRHAGPRSRPLFRLVLTTSLSGAQVTELELPSPPRKPLFTCSTQAREERKLLAVGLPRERDMSLQSAW